MGTQSILIILLATIIGFTYLMIARSYDIYEKEPIGKLILVTVFGGVVSVFVSLFLYRFVHVEYNFLDAIIKIGLIEEVSKLLALMLLVQFIKKDFNEIVDGIIYITAVALGFSVIENILYAISSETPFLLLLQRSFYSTLGHISFSGYLGIAYYIHVRVHRNYLGILLALILASVAHGFYDGVIFHPELGFLFKFVFAGLVIIQLIMLRMTLGFSKFRKVFSADIFTQTDNKAFLYCPQCDKSIEPYELSFWKIKAGECQSCNAIVLNEGNIKKSLRYFRPVVSMRRFFNAYKNSAGVA
ncbi:MAG: hypothetical protein C0599_05525, partial [Salinivirgaceae bacterium]